jgi:hypothetical protein
VSAPADKGRETNASTSDPGSRIASPEMPKPSIPRRAPSTSPSPPSIQDTSMVSDEFTVLRTKRSRLRKAEVLSIAGADHRPSKRRKRGRLLGCFTWLVGLDLGHLLSNAAFSFQSVIGVLQPQEIAFGQTEKLA